MRSFFSKGFPSRVLVHELFEFPMPRGPLCNVIKIAFLPFSCYLGTPKCCKNVRKLVIKYVGRNEFFMEPGSFQAKILTTDKGPVPSAIDSQSIKPLSERKILTFILCDFLVQTLQSFQKRFKFFFAHKKLKKTPSNSCSKMWLIDQLYIQLGTCVEKIKVNWILRLQAISILEMPLKFGDFKERKVTVMTYFLRHVLE